MKSFVLKINMEVLKQGCAELLWLEEMSCHYSHYMPPPTTIIITTSHQQRLLCWPTHLACLQLLWQPPYRADGGDIPLASSTASEICYIPVAEVDWIGLLVYLPNILPSWENQWQSIVQFIWSYLRWKVITRWPSLEMLLVRQFVLLVHDMLSKDHLLVLCEHKGLDLEAEPQDMVQGRHMILQFYWSSASLAGAWMLDQTLNIWTLGNLMLHRWDINVIRLII